MNRSVSRNASISNAALQNIAGSGVKLKLDYAPLALQQLDFINPASVFALELDRENLAWILAFKAFKNQLEREDFARLNSSTGTVVIAACVRRGRTGKR
jgi:hypothetical protein